jgi:hypothetical protein
MALSCVGLLVFGLMVIVNSEDCATEYQAALQQMLDLKETCSEAVYKDCCEVSYIPGPISTEL